MENQKAYTKTTANYAFKIVGHLGHDNLLFDRVCSRGCKGMFSSREHEVCPKCQGALTWITNAEGKHMAISEGTIYPSFGPKQDERDELSLSKRKNGMKPTYRFKMFSFADEEGTLMPPIEHARCVKGARVEILTMGHQIIPSWYQTKPKEDGSRELRVELLIMVYTNYGDYVKFISEKEHSDRVVARHPYVAEKTAAPAQLSPEAVAQLDRLEQQIAEIRANSGASTPPPPPKAVSAQAEKLAPWEGPDELGNTNDVDPFENAI